MAVLKPLHMLMLMCMLMLMLILVLVLATMHMLRHGKQPFLRLRSVYGRKKT